VHFTGGTTNTKRLSEKGSDPFAPCCKSLFLVTKFRGSDPFSYSV
jgi:hypothetical protein